VEVEALLIRQVSMPTHGSGIDTPSSANSLLPHKARAPSTAANGRPFGSALGLDTPDGLHSEDTQSDERLFTVKVGHERRPSWHS